MRKIVSFLILVTLLLAGSCKRAEQNANKPFLGKWTLILWNNEQKEGALVFTDSLLYFNIGYQTEVSKYSISKDTFRAQRVGGNMSFLSINDYWMVRQIDSVFLKLISSRGNVVTAYREKKFWNIKDNDTIALQL